MFNDVGLFQVLSAHANVGLDGQDATEQRGPWVADGFGGPVRGDDDRTQHSESGMTPK